MTTDIATITDSNKNLVRRNCCPSATDDEFEIFRAISNRYGLDPFCREVWFVKNGGSQAQIFIGRDGMLAIAHRSGQFDGMETKPDFDEHGSLVSATCTVWRKDMTHPFPRTVYLKEYSTGRSLWLTKPITMLQKVAEAQALRAAFSISGLYCQEELGGEEPGGIVVTESCTGVEPASRPEAQEKAEPRQDPGPVEAPKHVNPVSFKQVNESIIPTYERQHLCKDVFAKADLGDGFYDMDMIDADYRAQVFSGKPALPVQEKPAGTGPASASPEVRISGETCEVCGAKLLGGDVPTSRSFCDGHLFCEKHQREYIRRRRAAKA